MARILYVSKGYCTHDRRFLECLADVHEMWFLPCEAPSVRRDLTSLPATIRCLPPLSDCELALTSNSWADAERRFQQFIRAVSPGLVHAGPVPLGGYLTALADFHPALVMSWGSDVLAFPDESVAAKQVVQFSLQHCDMAVADCEAVRGRIMKLGGLASEQIVCLPWGVDLNVFRPKRPSLGITEQLGWIDCKVIISTRALEPTHSPFVLLEAIKQVLGEIPEARVLILGDGQLRGRVESFIRVNDLGDRVHLAGHVSEGVLSDYFAESDLYVSATKCDGSSISLLQAMACGLPAIVAGGYGNSEWIQDGENGWLYRAGDGQALAGAILKALADDDARQVAGEANIRIVRTRADWGRNFPRVLDAYEQLLGETFSKEMRGNAQLQNR